MPLAVYLLAVAVFAQATSEFMLAGLVPPSAAEFAVSSTAAGSLTSAFAAGMVVGAPLTALLARRFPPRVALLAFLVVFVAVHVLGVPDLGIRSRRSRPSCALPSRKAGGSRRAAGTSRCTASAAGT